MAFDCCGNDAFFFQTYKTIQITQERKEKEKKEKRKGKKKGKEERKIAQTVPAYHLPTVPSWLGITHLLPREWIIVTQGSGLSRDGKVH